MHTRNSRKAHKEKRRKIFVGQRLGVTPKSKSWLTPKRWLLIWIFVFYVSNSLEWLVIKVLLPQGSPQVQVT